MIGALQKQGDFPTHRSLVDEDDDERLTGKRVSLGVELGNEPGGVTKWIWWMLFLIALPVKSGRPLIGFLLRNACITNAVLVVPDCEAVRISLANGEVLYNMQVCTLPLKIPASLFSEHDVHNSGRTYCRYYDLHPPVR